MRKRVRLVGVLGLIVAGVLGTAAWVSRPNACDRRAHADNARFERLATHALRGARVTRRSDDCRFGGEAQLEARIPGQGRPGLHAASAALDRQGWHRTIGFDHLSPDGRTTLRFRFDDDSVVPDERSIEVILERLGARHAAD